MADSRRAQTWMWVAVFAVLLLSLSSFMTIPFMRPWPLDFQNLWTFHACPAGHDNPYLVRGRACGDVLGRNMLYPPLLYWSFAWVRWFSFETASLVWTTVIAAGTVLATAAWVPRAVWRDRLAGAAGLFVGLLVVQYPLLFAIERGNNDVIPLVTWTLAMWLWSRGHTAASGALAGLGAVVKIYPAFACVVVGVGLIGAAIRRREARPLLRFALGGLAVVALGFVATVDQSVHYATVTLPAAAALHPNLTVFGHPLRTLSDLGGGWALSAPLLAAWCVAAVLVVRRDPLLIFAGALAISTYFAQTSWDYDLITTYPLLVCLASRALAPRGLPALALLLLGLVGIVGHRALFIGHTAARVHIAVQWLFLLASGAAAFWLARPEDPAGPTADPAAPPA